jgi:hypothetical protein
VPIARRAHAVRVAIVATRSAGGPASEIQATLADAARCPPRSGSERSSGVQQSAHASGGWVSSRPTPMPDFAVELKALAVEPLPDRPEDDDVWQEACVCLVAEVGRPDLN